MAPYKDKEFGKKRQKEYSRNWYLKNREKQIQKSKENRKAKRKEWETYKASKKCSHCGFSHPAVIDFHHIIRKNKQSVNYLAVIKNNIPEAICEAETKCIPLCSNCHRILHWTEFQKTRPKKKTLTLSKSRRI